jgi:hypothetical protein
MAVRRTSASLPERLRLWSLALLLACCGAWAQGEERVLELESGELVKYRILQDNAGSAKPTAERLLRHLADGDIEEAALLSNAPRRRYEELFDYRLRVGENEFKRVFGQYFSPQNRLVAEIAIDAHRLLVWDLGEAGNHLAGQFYVEIEGRFLMDDVPSEARSRLRSILQAYRSGKLKP